MSNRREYNHSQTVLKIVTAIHYLTLFAGEVYEHQPGRQKRTDDRIEPLADRRPDYSVILFTFTTQKVLHSIYPFPYLDTMSKRKDREPGFPILTRLLTVNYKSPVRR